MKIRSAAESSPAYSWITQSRASESSGAEAWIVESAAAVHSTNTAANVAIEPAAVTREPSVAATAGESMTTTALREGRHQRQRKDERRKG